jgi:hypothetical protein
MSPTLTSPSSIAGTGGKISAAAFRRGVKPRGSTDPEDVVQGMGQRRLPVPPYEREGGGVGMEKRDSDREFGEVDGGREGENSPPQYGHEQGEGLRWGLFSGDCGSARLGESDI